MDFIMSYDIQIVVKTLPVEGKDNQSGLNR